MAHTPKTTVAVWPWPVSRLARGRILAFCGVFLLTVLVLCSVSLTVNTALLLEKRDPFKALFQPGDMVPIRLDEKSGPSSKVNTAIGPNQLTIAAMDQQPAQPTVLPELSSALFGSESTLSPPLNLSVGSPGTRLDDATETEASQSPSEVLLTLLKDALAKAINISASATETSTQAQTLFRFTGSLAPATPFAATSSSQSFPLSQPNTLVSYGSGPRLAKRSGQPDLGAEIFPILSPVSGVVAHFAVVDVNATAKLVSSVLSALSIDTSTVDKVLLEVASQTSTKLEQVLPLVIPAVSSLLDQHIDDSPLRDDINATAVCQDVVQNGIAIINQIARTTTYPMDARLQAVTDSIDVIVRSASRCANDLMCIIKAAVEGVTEESVVPCADTSRGVPPGNVVTLNAMSIAPGAATSDPLSWIALAVGSPLVDYSISIPLPTESTALPTSSLPPYGPGQPQTTAAQDTASCEESTILAIATASPSSSGCPPVLPCPTCPSCNDCPCRQCSPSPSCSTATPSDPKQIGPCPERGFHCSDCLNGWFCPPQETPAQPVPCGLGWPCYHCKSRWFCAQDIPASPTLPLPAGTASSAGAVTTPSSLLTPASDTAPPASNSLQSWQYVGCFHDAINRTLAGSKPLDYLRGDMSNSTCIDHCKSRGYTFAGTECGKECWCGSSIRDDAVRLPDSSCGSPCQGAGGQFCGGDWAISVFTCSDASGPASGNTPAEKSCSTPPATSEPAPSTSESTPAAYEPPETLITQNSAETSAETYRPLL